MPKNKLEIITEYKDNKQTLIPASVAKDLAADVNKGANAKIREALNNRIVEACQAEPARATIEFTGLTNQIIEELKTAGYTVEYKYSRKENTPDAKEVYHISWLDRNVI